MKQQIADCQKEGKDSEKAAPIGREVEEVNRIRKWRKH